ncbi:MAG: hypothetical protein GEV08_11855 [Acidimicrobiia bacterium]|nr:hypothetical protein [Acidimicrobiia bacterium]
MPGPPERVVPPWATRRQACRLILRGVTLHTASRVALVVGTLLSVVNQGSVLIAGDASVGTVIRVVVNYLVPFTVASVGYLAPFRQPR